MDIGNRILTLRKELGYSRKVLSDKSKVSESAIKQYETGKRQPKIEQLQLIADALGVKAYELMGIPKAKAVAPCDPDSIRPDEVRDIEEEALEQSVVADFRKMNLTGKREAAIRVNELTEVSRYRKDVLPDEA